MAGFSFTESSARRIARAVREVERAGTDLRGRPKRNIGETSPIVFVRIVSAASGGGKYNGKILIPPTSAGSATGNLSASDAGTDGPDCLVFNFREVGKSTHDLTDAANTDQHYFAGFIRNATSDGTPIVHITDDWFEDCTEEA